MNDDSMVEIQMTNKISADFDLEERTAVFGQSVIRLCKKLKQDSVTRRIIDQLIGSATSVGANYCEANNAGSRKDFQHKISLCKKESREAMFFLRMIGEAAPNSICEARNIWQEAKELNLIFGAIHKKTAEKIS